MSRRVPQLALSLALVGAAAVPVLSAEPTADDVRAAYGRLSEAWTAKTAGHRSVLAKGQPVRGPIGDPDSEWGRLLTSYRDAQRAFMDAFRASRWSALDAATDHELLRVGLSEIVDEALLLGPDARAVRAAETLVERLPDTNAARYAIGWRLPVLLAETHGLAPALERAERLREQTRTDTEKRLLDTWRGDALAALGRADAARAAWTAAAAAGEEPARRRVALAGRALPALPPGKDVGGTARIAPGKVNVVLFLGSSDFEGLSLATRLEDWLGSLAGERPNVVGVVVPVNGTLVTDGRRRILERTETRRVGHDTEASVEALRRALGITFPCRINADPDGTWAGAPQHLIRAVVVGRDGKVVAFSGREAHVGLVRAAATRLLETR